MIIMEYLKNAKNIFDLEYGANSTVRNELKRMIPDTVDVDTLILVFKIGTNGTNHSTSHMTEILDAVKQCADEDFFHEFRIKYYKEILGIDCLDVQMGEYGYNELEENVIDISNKDVYEVLAGLYNAATPIANGFFQYNPITWTKETAKEYVKQYGQGNEDNSLNFGYICGRPVRFKLLKGHLLYVHNYNYDNEPGLAQRVLSNIPNIEKDKIEDLPKKKRKSKKEAK